MDTEIVINFVHLLKTANDELTEKSIEKSKWQKEIDLIQEDIINDSVFDPDHVVRREKKLATCLINIQKLEKEIGKLTEVSYYAGYHPGVVDELSQMLERIINV